MAATLAVAAGLAACGPSESTSLAGAPSPTEATAAPVEDRSPYSAVPCNLLDADQLRWLPAGAAPVADTELIHPGTGMTVATSCAVREPGARDASALSTSLTAFTFADADSAAAFERADGPEGTHPEGLPEATVSQLADDGTRLRCFAYVRSEATLVILILVAPSGGDDCTALSVPLLETAVARLHSGVVMKPTQS